jgi:3-hydroxyacyl-CoA dehydrogenase
MDIKNIFVVGAGYMGNGIAQASILAGYHVKMNDVSDQRLQAGLEEIKKSLGKFVAKNKLTKEQYQRALERLSVTTDFEGARDADLALEAVPEKYDLKKDIFRRLDRICPAHAILATNTSALSISSIASATARPDKVVGTHFFGPVPLMRLCEVIRGLLTSQEATESAFGWVKSLGKDPVLVKKDHAGFIANRVTLPGTLEAVNLVDKAIATPEEVDRASGDFEAGNGPFQISDNAGLDVVFNAAMAVYEDTKDPIFLPPPILQRLIAEGLTGRKAGKGFYDYSSGKRESYLKGNGEQAAKENEADRAAKANRFQLRYRIPAILEAVRVLDVGVGSAEDIDKATRLGFNFAQGRLEIADTMGLDTVAEMAMGFYKETGDVKFFPPPLLRRMVAAGLLGRKSGRGFFTYSS